MKKEVKKKLKKQFREDGPGVDAKKQSLTVEEQEELDQCVLQERQNSASKDQQYQFEEESESKDNVVEAQKNGSNAGSSASNNNHKEGHPCSVKDLQNGKLRVEDPPKSEDEEEGKIDDEDEQNLKSENEEPVIDVEEIRNKLLFQTKGNSNIKQDLSSSSEEEEDEEEYQHELRERVATISQFESKSGISNMKKLIASESSEQENYYRLFNKPEQETENPQENDDNDDQEEVSDASPKQEVKAIYLHRKNGKFKCYCHNNVQRSTFILSGVCYFLSFLFI